MFAPRGGRIYHISNAPTWPVAMIVLFVSVFSWDECCAILFVVFELFIFGDKSKNGT